MGRRGVARACKGPHGAVSKSESVCVGEAHHHYGAASVRPSGDGRWRVAACECEFDADDVQGRGEAVAQEQRVSDERVGRAGAARAEVLSAVGHSVSESIREWVSECVSE